MDFVPAYRLFVTLPSGIYQLTTLYSLNSGLTCGIDLGGFDLVLADPTLQVGALLGAPVNGLPVCLNAPITVQCTNIWGEIGTAWSGFITSAGPSFDTTSGFIYKITAGDGLKPFAVQTQSGSQVAALTVSELSNISASQVLQFAASAIGFPASKLAIAVQVDAGSGIQQSIPPATFISPQQASWLAVLNGVAQFTGNILFADEQGLIQYRPINYQQPPTRFIPASVVHQSYLANSDEDLLTHVEVRYGLVPIASAAPLAPTVGSAQATQLAAWDQQLGQRKLVTYMPWLLNTQAAQWVATTLLNQGVAQMGIGQVTIVGDHAYHVGDTVRLAYAGKDAFIQTVSQQWQWGAQWLTTLGLTFVRDSGSQLATSVQPSATALAGFPGTTASSALTVPQQQAQQIAAGTGVSAITLLLTATASKTAIPVGYNVVGPSNLFATGSTAIIQDASSNGAVALGPSPSQGQYLISAQTPVSQGGTLPDGSLLIYDPTNADNAKTSPEQVDVTVTFIPAPQAAFTAPGAPPTPQSAAKTAVQVTVNPAAGTPSVGSVFVPATQGASWRDTVMQRAMSFLGSPYVTNQPSFNSLGQAVGYNCVGMIYVAMNTSGYLAHLTNAYPLDTYMIQLNNGIFWEHVFSNIPGGTVITPPVPPQAQQGDILLFTNTGGGWAGDPGAGNSQGLVFTHAALALGSYAGPSPYWVGGALPTTTAMVTANSAGAETGVVLDDFNSSYWAPKLVMIVRPNWT